MLNEGQHDADVRIAIVDKVLERLELHLEDFNITKVAPYATPAEHRVRLLLAAFHLSELVGRGVEGAHPHGSWEERVDHCSDALFQLTNERVFFVVFDVPVRVFAHTEDHVFDP